MNTKPVTSYCYKNVVDNTDLTMVVGTSDTCRIAVKFIGDKIPFPVRSNTWMTPGLTVRKMHSYLLQNYGYALVSHTNLESGKCHTYLNCGYITDLELV